VTFKRNEALRSVTDVDECMLHSELREFFYLRGYEGVWAEDTDQGLVLHGVSLGRDEGGNEVIVPEGWMNK
jgi:hypothetical protein